MVTFSLLALMGVWLWYEMGPGYFRERDRLQRSLSAVEGVTVLLISGHDDFGFQLHGATVFFDGDPARSATIAPSATSPVVRDVGGYRFAVRYPDNAFGDSIDLGPDGPLGTRLPVTINGVADLREHYDEVVAFLATLDPAPAEQADDSGRGVRWMVLPPGQPWSYGTLDDDHFPPSASRGLPSPTRLESRPVSQDPSP